MRVKSCPIRIKAAGTQDGTDDGVFEAIVATYDLDSYGDKILPGAFEATLAEWKAKGDPIPVIWSHMAYDPDMHIGVVLDAKEREYEGLWVKAKLELEEPTAAKVYKLLKGRRVTQFSFMFDVDEGAWVEAKDDHGPYRGYYELRKLSLYEVGPCLVGVNKNTELLDIKGRDLRLLGQFSPAERAAVEAILGPEGVKAGRVLSGKNETSLREALTSIDSGAAAIKTVLAALEDTTEDDDAKTSDASEQKASQAAPAPTSQASPTGPATAGDGPAKATPASVLAHTGVDLVLVDADLLLH